jgi:hypothetical protein
MPVRINVEGELSPQAFGISAVTFCMQNSTMRALRSCIGGLIGFSFAHAE